MSESATLSVTPMRQRVAEEVRVLLARRQMSASELARRIGLTQPYMSRRLTGEIAFDVDDLEVIAAALGVKPAELLGSTSITPRYTKPAGRSTSAPPARTDAKPAPTRAGRPPSYPGNARRPQLLNGRSGR